MSLVALALRMNVVRVSDNIQGFSKERCSLGQIGEEPLNCDISRSGDNDSKRKIGGYVVFLDT